MATQVNGARAILVIGGQRILGWLTDVHPDAPGEVVLVLDDDLSGPLRSRDLPLCHFIELHGSPERVRHILLAAGEAGFAVGWPADDPLPRGSRN